MRFYLHIRDGERFIEDPEGEEFDSLDDARREAVAAARDLLAELLKAGKILDGQRIEICDESGRLRDTVAFRDTYRVE